MELEILQIGTIGAVFAFFIREVFIYLTAKKGDNSLADGDQNVIIARIDERLKAIESNHLPHIDSKLSKLDEDMETLKGAIAEIKIKLEEVL